MPLRNKCIIQMLKLQSMKYQIPEVGDLQQHQKEYIQHLKYLPSA